MKEESADELLGGKRHSFLLALVAVVLVSEADQAGFDVQQTVVGDCHPVRISADIIQHLFWPSEGRLGIDHPFRLSQRCQVASELAAIAESLQSGKEMQLAGLERALETLHEEAAEQARQHAHR